MPCITFCIRNICSTSYVYYIYTSVQRHFSSYFLYCSPSAGCRCWYTFPVTVVYTIYSTIYICILIASWCICHCQLIRTGMFHIYIRCKICSSIVRPCIHSTYSQIVWELSIYLKSVFCFCISLNKSMCIFCFVYVSWIFYCFRFIFKLEPVKITHCFWAICHKFQINFVITWWYTDGRCCVSIFTPVTACWRCSNCGIRSPGHSTVINIYFYFSTISISYTVSQINFWNFSVKVNIVFCPFSICKTTKIFSVYKAVAFSFNFYIPRAFIKIFSLNFISF